MLGGAVVSVDAETLRAQADGGTRFTLSGISVDADTVVDLELERFRVTGPDTRFVVGRAAGQDVAHDFDADAVLLLRGNVSGRPRSHVFMAVSDSMSFGRIDLGQDEPSLYLSSGPAAAGIVELTVSPPAPPADLLPGVPFCGASPGSIVPAHPLQALGLVQAESTQQIELALETDYELFELFGSLDATSEYLVALWGAVTDIYLRDVNARIHLTFVRLWDDPDDLFNIEDPILEFRDYWEANMGAVHRDVAQFVSGRRNFPYGGIAFLEVLCTSNAYGISGYIIGEDQDFLAGGIFGYDVLVTAHELGHNCATLHTHDYELDTCDELFGPPQRATIMSYCSMTRSGANTNIDMRFHTFTQGVMRGHIFTAPCIAEDCNGNAVADPIDISQGASDDLNANGIPDECEDCNGNGTLDPDDISSGDSTDLDANGVPDECQADCNANTIPDAMDVALGAADLNSNNVPDACEADCNTNGTADHVEIQADMSLDIDRNAVLDSCQDCDGDAIPDLEELEGAYNVWVGSEVSPSLSEFHALSGVKAAESSGTALSFPADLVITGDRRILVSSALDDRVVEFDRLGGYVGDLVAAGSGGLVLPTGLVVSPAGTLLVGSRNTHEVLEYDLSSGAPLGVFVSAGAGGLLNPFGLAFGPNGNLFVTSNTDEVLEYDGVTGAPVGTFVSAAGNGALNVPRGILFKPDGNLLVASYNTNQILEYDGVSGVFVGQFNNGGTATVLTLDQPWGLRLGPDGDVYASRHQVSAGLGPGDGGQNTDYDWSLHDHHVEDDIAGLHINSTRIYIFDVDSGIFVRTYVTGHDTGLSFPTGFDFMPGETTDADFNLIPDECETPCPGDVNGDGEVGIADFLAVIGGWGTPAGDLDGDGDTGITDFLIVIGNWGTCP